MTESEALNMIQATLICMELYDLSYIEKGCDRKCENCEYNYAQGNNGEQKEALKVAMQALEKQIPKKPIRIGKDTCPKCGTYNETWVKRRNTLPNDIVYCWHFGQAVEITRE